MVAPSKIFQYPLNCYHCSQSIIHPGIGCFSYSLTNFPQYAISCMKYYLPLLVTPLVVKYKNMNQDLLVKTIKFYLQTVCWSTLISSSIFCYVCCLRNLLGSYRKYTTVFIPTVLGMQYIWFIPSKLLKLFTVATSQAALETALRHFPNKLTHLILQSPAVQTMLFMLNSAIILHYKRKNVYKDFWFIQPYEKVVYGPPTNDLQTTNLRIKDETTDNKYMTNKCNHKNSTCMRFILEGIKSYLFYGIPLDLLSMAMKSRVPRGTQGFICQCLERFKKFRPNMTGFFISYVGIYRLSSCLIRKYYAHLPLDLQHILSAFMGGFSYLCIRRTNFLTLSMVITVQLLWQEFCKDIKITEKKKKKKTNLVLWIVKNAPLAQIIVSLNVGYLVHIYIINYKLLSGLARGFIDGVTSNRLRNIHSLLINTDLQTITKLVEQNPKIKKFF